MGLWESHDKDNPAAEIYDYITEDSKESGR